MKRVLLFSGIAVLVLLAIGGVVFSLLSKKEADIAPVIEAATIDFAEGLAKYLQRVEYKRQFEFDGLTTKLRLQIKNTGGAACEFKLLEYKLAGRAPRESLIPFEVARLDPGQTEVIQLTFENVPWVWTDREASISESLKGWSRTLSPKDAPPGHKLAVSSSGEWSGSNQITLDAEEFKNALPILKEQYPKITQLMNLSGTAKREGDLTTVTLTFSNNGDIPFLDLSIRNAQLRDNGQLAGELDPSTPMSYADFKPGESKTFNARFKNVPLDFSKSDSPSLNLVIEYATRQVDSVMFKGKTFYLSAENRLVSNKAYIVVPVKRLTPTTGPTKKS
jgi:hypothetical protein